MMYRVFAVSDGSGRTAKRALVAAPTQFVGAEVEIERRAEVRTDEQVRQAVREVAQVDGFIVHTLVSDGLRKAIRRPRSRGSSAN